MMTLPFMALAHECAPQVAPQTMAAIVRTESSFNPYAIGVVDGRLLRQPASRDEAIATARALEAGGWNYSVGLAQVNRKNWSRYGLDVANAFEPCRNLAAGAAILADCYRQARTRWADSQGAVRASLSCYASGSFTAGYRTGYVQRVVDNVSAGPGPGVPAIDPRVTPIPVVPVDQGGAAGRLRREGTPYGQPASGDGRGREAREEGGRQGLQESPADSSAVVF